jgi:hypothetical protein
MIDVHTTRPITFVANHVTCRNAPMVRFVDDPMSIAIDALIAVTSVRFAFFFGATP